MSTATDERTGDEQVRIPAELPVLPLRDMVLYPFIIAPLSVARDVSIQAVDKALAENRMILLVAQKDKDEEEPAEADLFRVGTVAVIMRMLKLPDERIRVLVQGVARFLRRAPQPSPLEPLERGLRARASQLDERWLQLGGFARAERRRFVADDNGPVEEAGHG